MAETVPVARDKELVEEAFEEATSPLGTELSILRTLMEWKVSQARQEGREESEARVRELEGLNEQSRKLPDPVWPREKL